ncbi:MAG: acyl-CoA thioesterase [Acidimicrobiales bacterium]
MPGQSELMAALELEPAGDGRFVAHNLTSTPGSVVFGGQLLAQTVVAAATADPSKEVKSVHTVFARGGSLGQDLEIEVEPMHLGRALGSATVTIRQGERLCTRSLVLLSAAEPDLIRHQPEVPDVGGPEHAAPSGGESAFWEIRVVGGADIADPAAVGPATLDVWVRFPGAVGGDSVDADTVGRAVIAYSSDGFLIGTAMRPHEGFGQSLAHVAFSTSVLTQTLTFHEPVVPDAWYLLSHESPYAGRGRSYGRAHVFAEDGRLVASFVQDNMIRSFPEGRQPAAGERSRY